MYRALFGLGGGSGLFGAGAPAAGYGTASF
jgi:hypothetical protein